MSQTDTAASAASRSLPGIPASAGARFARVIGVGSALPARRVTNDDLVADLAARGVETSDEWISTRTGIRQRWLAGPDDTTTSLGARAARAAMEMAGVGPDDIDLVVCATSTPDQIFPSTACLIQNELGIHQGGAFDVQAVCSGFVYAMANADALIRAGVAKRALVIGADVFSRIMDWNDRSTCVLFGGGAGAVLLSASDTPGVLVSRLHVPHQANSRILSATASRLGLPEDKVVSTVAEHANTSAASVPLALTQAVKDGRIKPGHLVLMEGVGGGFTWAANLIRF